MEIEHYSMRILQIDSSIGTIYNRRVKSILSQKEKNKKKKKSMCIMHEGCCSKPYIFLPFFQ